MAYKYTFFKYNGNIPYYEEYQSYGIHFGLGYYPEHPDLQKNSFPNFVLLDLHPVLQPGASSSTAPSRNHWDTKVVKLNTVCKNHRNIYNNNNCNYNVFKAIQIFPPESNPESLRRRSIW